MEFSFIVFCLLFIGITSGSCLVVLDLSTRLLSNKAYLVPSLRRAINILFMVLCPILYFLLGGVNGHNYESSTYTLVYELIIALTAISMYFGSYLNGVPNELRFIVILLMLVGIGYNVWIVLQCFVVILPIIVIPFTIIILLITRIYDTAKYFYSTT